MTDKNYFGDARGFNGTSFMDAAYQLNPREVTALNKIVYKVVRNLAIAESMFPKIKIPAGTKDYKLSVEIEQDAPLFTDDFMTEDLDTVQKEEKIFYPIYMHKDFMLKKVDIDGSHINNYYNLDLKQLTLRGTTNTIVDYRERVMWRGYDIAGRGVAAVNKQGSIDSNSLGILNTSGTNAFTAGAGGDADITVAGDGTASIGFAVDSLVEDIYFGPYWCIMTPKVRGRFGINFNTTTHITDIERMQAMIDEGGNKILRGIKVTPYMINQLETGNLGSIALVDPKTNAGEPTIVLGEVYSVSHAPTTQNSFGIKGKVYWAGIPIVIRPEAITIENTIDFTA